MKKIMLLFLLLQNLFLFAQAPVISGNEILCANTNGSAMVTNTVTYDTYQWYKKFMYDENPVYEIIPGATSDYLTYNLDYDGYKVKVVTTLNGITYESNELELNMMFDFGIIVQSVINGENSYIDDTGIHICEGESITFTVLGLYSYSVQWYKNDILLDAETGASITVTQTGDYRAIGAKESCPEDYAYSLTEHVVVETCGHAGNNDNVLDSKIDLYPNPTKDIIHIKNVSTFNLNKYEIYTIEGKLVQTNSLAENTNSIALNNLSQGIYFIKLFSGDKSVTKKIILN